MPCHILPRHIYIAGLYLGVFTRSHCPADYYPPLSAGLRLLGVSWGSAADRRQVTVLLVLTADVIADA